ncbi:hypothetical protein [Dactylosporangium matsuzakiense]|uniref:Uncharacterized protein n=1 Tax=Dactylosporangium matsuzakiense TaxID=53360 RepID=A0A9W6KTJ0_9ACTN|nr:hypothetical protein [Dactylosporangium matsuzakiense]UWZ48591.1 hypothetical protein Dmats_20600 [Dactylosporangium matsuzakiense]GLL06424.1 hypothetical protein GCM10017581_081740 [Dactylosporangium matsuzakiense]
MHRPTGSSPAASSLTFKQAVADRPGSTGAIGGGGATTDGDHQLGLRLSRPAAPLDVAPATGREDANGCALDRKAGPYFLQPIYPFGVRSWSVEMTGPPNNQITVQALCGY